MASIPREVFEKYAIEYQGQISESSKELAIIRGQLQAKERDRKVSQLTGNELADMKDVKAYRSVGKMYNVLI